MTQPRSGQIKDINTRYAVFNYPAVSNTPLTSIPAATLNLFTITSTAGGVNENTPAFVEGGTEPFGLIVAGDAFTISVDGAAAVTVIFTAADIISGKIVARINIAVGFTVAFNVNGKIKLISPTLGTTSTILLSDAAPGVPGTLAKIGFSNGLSSGFSVPTATNIGSSIRGIITTSSDTLGGFVPLKLTNGESLLCDSSGVVTRQNGSTFRLGIINLRGGYPIHARLLYDGANYNFNYFVSAPSTANVITGDSTFGTLGIGDSFTINVGTGPFLVAFTGAETTAATVTDRINYVTSTVLNFVTPGDGSAAITGTISGPFTFDGNEILNIEVDGGAPQSVIFVAGTFSASAIIATINGALVGATATIFSPITGGEFVTITSNNTVGRTSSLKILNDFDSIHATLRLGLTPGFYRGIVIADIYGTESIIISNFERGSPITIGGTPGTLVKLGLTAGVFNSSIETSEVKVNLPELSSPFEIQALIPECLEFGEVPQDTDSIIEEFGSQGSGQNVLNSSLLAQTKGIPDTFYYRGNLDSGKSLTLTQNGTLDKSLFSQVTADYMNLFKKFIRGNFITSQVDALVAKNIETPGTAGNTEPKSATFTVDVDPDGSFVGTEQFIVQMARDAASSTPFLVSAAGAIVGLDWVIAAGASNTSFGNITSEPIKFNDLYTLAAGNAAGGAALRYLNLTGTTLAGGDQYLRILEKEVTDLQIITSSPPVSMIGHSNARWTVTAGDGTNSFGDFNGPDAIQQILAFMTIKGLTNAIIEMKIGAYVAAAGVGNNIVVPAGWDIELRGSGTSLTGTTITNNNAVASISIAGTTKLKANNIKFNRTVGSANAVLGSGVNSQVDFENCLFQNQVLNLPGSVTTKLQSCVLDNTIGPVASPLVHIEVADGQTGVQVFIDDCDFSTNGSRECLSIRAAAVYAAGSIVDLISCRRSRINLGTTTISGGGNPVSNCGVINIDPNGNGIAAGIAITMVVNYVKFEDCVVSANSFGGTNSILLYQRNSKPGGAAVVIKKFEIDGGTWTSPSTGTGFTPFYFGNETTTTLPIPVINVSGALTNNENITVRNVTFGWKVASSVPVEWSNGSCSTETGAVPQANWFSHFLSSNSVNFEDVKFIGLINHSGCGDLLIRGGEVNINNIDMTGYRTTAAAAVPLPNDRILFDKFIAGSAFEAHDVKINCVPGIYATSSIINLKPNGSMLIDGFSILNFSSINAFIIPEAAGATNVGLTLTNCEVFGCATILNSLNITPGLFPLTNSIIKGNKFSGFSLFGILLSSTLNPIEDIIISNNVFTSGVCTTIVAIGTKTIAPTGTGFVIDSNTIIAAYSTAGILVTQNVGGTNLYGSITGNSIGDVGALPGVSVITSGSLCTINGLETYAAFPAVGTAGVVTNYAITGERMARNNAKLVIA